MTIQALTDNTTRQNGSAPDETFAANAEMTQLRELTATTNYGTQDYAEATKWSSGNHTHAIVKIDLSNVPANATINSATLYLKSRFTGGTQTIDIRAILRNWVETQATWNIYSTGNSWTTAGCLSDGNDRKSTVLANTSVTGDETYHSWDVTSHVQSIVNGNDSNYGFHLERNGTGNESSVFSQWYTDNATDGSRPEMIIDYTESSGPSIPVVMHHRRMQGIS